MTGLGTRGCQGVQLGLELDRVCQVVRSLKAEDWRLNSRRSEFEYRRLDLVSIGSEFVSVVHKGVTGHNSIPPSRISPRDPKVMRNHKDFRRGLKPGCRGCKAGGC